MGVAGYLIRHRLRRRWMALVPVALVVALGATAALVAAGAADRTANAYSRHLDQADVGDLVINPSLSTTEIDEVIRALPGVRSVTRDALFAANIHDGTPRPVGETVPGHQVLHVRGSLDGRYTAMDRPAIVEGRLPTGTGEAFVNEELADAEDLEVGDRLPLTFDRPADELLLNPETVVAPVGAEQLRVVGIGTFADEVLPDGVFQRLKVIVSPDVAERYDCLPGVPPRDATFEQAVAAVLPHDCATAYPYYAVAVDGGAPGVAAVLDAFISRSDELNAELPRALLEAQYGYFLASATTAQEQARVERSTQPTVAALGVLAMVAAAITLIVLALLVARDLQRSEVDIRQWWHLGSATSDRALALLVPLAVAVAAGLAAALLLAWLLSPVAPVGLVRSIDPSPARQLSTLVSLGALALGAIFLVTLSALTVRAARRTDPVATRARNLSAMRRLIPGSARPEIDEGMRAAYGNRRGAGLVVASGAVASALFMAAMVFSTSLSAMSSTSSAYGWPWDVGLMGGVGYGLVDLDAAKATLDAHEDIERWTGLGFMPSVTVDGTPVLTVIGLHQASDVNITAVEGRLPGGAGEIALGSRTAADLGVGVGDRVELGGEGIDPQSATVTGVVVLPALGPILSDRTGPGTGLLLPAAALPSDGHELFTATNTLSFIGIELAPGTDSQRLLSDLRDEFPSWDPFGQPAIEITDPVRPAEIVNLESMQAVPLLVGGLLMSTALIGLVGAVIVSVRSRRRDLAVLRVLGFTGRQLRDSVRVQTVATTGAALIVGGPIGIALGRIAWRAFAAQLGVVTEPSTPVWWVAATVAGALVITLPAAAVPARSAARIEPAATLRSE